MDQKKRVLQGLLLLGLLTSCQGKSGGEVGRKEALTALTDAEEACQKSDFVVPGEMTCDWTHSGDGVFGSYHLVVSEKGGGYFHLLAEQKMASSLESTLESYVYFASGELYTVMNYSTGKTFSRSPVASSYVFPYRNTTAGTLSRIAEIKRVLQGFSSKEPLQESYAVSSSSFQIHYEMMATSLTSMVTATSYDYHFENNLLVFMRVAAGEAWSEMAYQEGVAALVFPDLSTYTEVDA
jgi:hypothetical protein